jgi:phosphoribosylformimino-5-aminoimidazole carboxamide ribotide isomerase
MVIYPAIDLIEGKVVRLSQGSFDRKSVYSGDPVATALGFKKAGAEWIHVVDLDAARLGRLAQIDIIAAIARETRLKLQVGGGVRSAKEAEALLGAGVSRVVLGSLAATRPEDALSLIQSLGADAFTLALDVRSKVGDEYRIAVSGWTEDAAVTPFAFVERYAGAGVSHYLCTDISRDGKLGGPAFGLYRELLGRFPSVKLQASGGIGTLDDLRELSTLGAASAIVGRALYEGRFTLEEALRCS